MPASTKTRAGLLAAGLLLAALPASSAVRLAASEPAGSGGPAGRPPSATHPLGECASCGKRIYFGERCLTCITRERREAAEHPCADCAEPILLGERCTPCALVHHRARLADLTARAGAALAHPCADCEDEILLGERCRPCAARDLERRLGSLLTAGRDGLASGAEAAGTLAPAVRARLAALVGAGQDAQQREAEAAADAATEGAALERYAAGARAWALEGGASLREGLASLGERPLAAVGTALEVAAGLQRAKRELTHAGLDGLGRIPVTSELGRTSLEELAGAKLLEAAPGLAGSELVDDPAAALAALITLDHLYFLTDLQLVEAAEPGAPPLTVIEALEARSGTDPSATLALLTILESVRKVRHGEDLTRALHDIERSLELLNPSSLEEAEPAGPPSEPDDAR